MRSRCFLLCGPSCVGPAVYGTTENSSFQREITYLLLLYCPKAAKRCGRIEKSMEGRCFSPNRAKAGRRKTNFPKTPLLHLCTIYYYHI